MKELFRLVEQDPHGRGAIYDRNSHAGMILCGKHLHEVEGYGVEPMADKIDEDVANLFEPQCQLCTTPTNSGLRCHNEACDKPLHPNWPAVYCSNRCAIEDI